MVGANACTCGFLAGLEPTTRYRHCTNEHVFTEISKHIDAIPGKPIGMHSHTNDEQPLRMPAYRRLGLVRPCAVPRLSFTNQILGLLRGRWATTAHPPPWRIQSRILPIQMPKFGHPMTQVEIAFSQAASLALTWSSSAKQFYNRSSQNDFVMRRSLKNSSSTGTGHSKHTYHQIASSTPVSARCHVDSATQLFSPLTCSSSNRYVRCSPILRQAANMAKIL